MKFPSTIFAMLLLLFFGISSCTKRTPEECFVGIDWTVDQDIANHIPMEMKFNILHTEGFFEAHVASPDPHSMNKEQFRLLEVNRRPTLEKEMTIHDTCKHLVQIWEKGCRFKDIKNNETIRKNAARELYIFVVPIGENCDLHSSGGTGHLGQAHTHGE